MLPRLKLLRLSGHKISIFDQLRIEEALYRQCTQNWCLLNVGADPGAVVMGFGGKPHLLLDIPRVKERNVTVIRRFTGGGTVVVDGNSLFASLIGNFSDIGVPKGPRELMRWSETVYKPVFDDVMASRRSPGSPSFALRENDYVIGEHKFGGNAQGISRQRTPEYRRHRTHTDFLCKLKDHVSSQDEFEASLIKQLGRMFEVSEGSIEEANAILASAPSVSTRIETLQ